MSSAYVIDETAQARAELASGQYGVHQNAEDLIRSHFASVPPEVRSGLRLAENTEVLAKAKDAEAGKEIEVPEGGRLIDWTVRGTDPRRMVISYVWEDATGRWYHGVQGYGGDYEAPDESPAERATREVALADHRVKKEGVVGNAELEAKLAEHRLELEAELGERFASLKDDLVETIQKLAETDDDEPKTEKKSRATATARKSSVTATGSADGKAPESGSAPEDTHDDGSDTGEGTGDDDAVADEVSWPRSHDDMDALAKKGGLKKADLPDDWDDRKLPEKQEFLESKGIKPEAQG